MVDQAADVGALAVFDHRDDDFNLTLGARSLGMLYFARYNHWQGSPWHDENSAHHGNVTYRTSPTPQGTNHECNFVSPPFSCDGCRVGGRCRAPRSRRTFGARHRTVQTSPPSTYKFSLAAYSYRELLTGKKYGKQWKIEDFIEECAALPLEGTELTSYYFAKDITPDYLHHLKREAFLLGLDISGTAVRNDFCLPNGPKRDEEIRSMKRWIEYADLLGAPFIRIFAGHVGKDQSAADAHRLMVEGISECCEYAGKYGIILALENHHGPTATADGLLAIVRDVNSPWFGVNFDSGNFHDSDDVYAELAQIAPYSVNAQIKASITPADGKKRLTDYPRVANILKGAGYRGYIVLELEEPEDPRVACPRELRKLREAFA